MEKRIPHVIGVIAGLLVLASQAVQAEEASNNSGPATPMFNCPRSGMPMMQGGSPMLNCPRSGMPMMYGPQSGMPMMQGGMPMSGYQGYGPMGHRHPYGKGQHPMHAMPGAQHMQRIEARLANIEALLRELVALQRSR